MTALVVELPTDTARRKAVMAESDNIHEKALRGQEPVIEAGHKYETVNLE